MTIGMSGYLNKDDMQKDRAQKRRDEAAVRKQIRDRVAPAPKEFVPNVVKKVYAEGSFGAKRKALPTTLTALRYNIEECGAEAHVVQPIDEHGNPVGEPTVTARRNTAKCTRARRNLVTRGLLAPSGSTFKKRRKRGRAGACNSAETISMKAIVAAIDTFKAKKKGKK